MPDLSGAIAFPGPEGSFSQQAAVSFFGEDKRYRPYETFGGVLAALLNGEAGYAVLPIENSSAGGVLETYDLLLKHELHIVGEQVVAVAHHLLTVPGSTIETIREVHSHPQALEQCRGFFTAHPGIVAVPSLNTALSAKSVKEWGDRSKAAIAGSLAARLYGLEVLQENIHDNPYNTTRFVVVSRESTSLRTPDKATVTFLVANQVGSLAMLLTCFAEHGVNLSKIESRPIPGRSWEYFFFADFEGAMDEAELNRALEAASGCSRELRLMGRYAKAR
jgi:chorismate mutase/prephenate dehydratase